MSATTTLHESRQPIAKNTRTNFNTQTHTALTSIATFLMQIMCPHPVGLNILFVSRPDGS